MASPSYIHDDVELVDVDAVNLQHLEGNPNKGDALAVARSFARFGQRYPIVVRRTGDGQGVITAGNTRWDAVRILRGHAQAMAAAHGSRGKKQARHRAENELGSDAVQALERTIDTDGPRAWQHAQVTWVDEPAEEGEAFALADNRTARLGHDDPKDLLRMLKRVRQHDEALLQSISYDDADITDLAREVKDLERRAPQVAQDLPRTISSRSAPDDADHGGPSPARVAGDDAFEAAGNRSVVLVFPTVLHAWVTSHMGALRRELGLADPRDVLVALLEDRTGQVAPRDPTPVIRAPMDDE